MATEKNEEGDIIIFNKRLNKLLNKTRIQDSMCGLCLPATDPEHRPRSTLSPPLAAPGRYRQGGQVGRRW